MMKGALPPSLPDGMWVPEAFPGLTRLIPAHRERWQLRGRSGDAGSSEGLCLQQGTHRAPQPSASLGYQQVVAVPWHRRWQDLVANSRARLRLTIAQVRVRRRLAHFPRLLRGKQQRSGGAEGRR